MTLVSIIIPAYNAAETLTETIFSALKQSHRAKEIIVVVDGATDGTAAMARSIARDHPDLRVIEQDNRGLAGARNRGIVEARGQYVAPLDADDIWHRDKIALQLSALESEPGAALAYGWFRNIDTDNRVFPGSASPNVSGHVYYRHLDWNFISNGSAPLVRTDVARDILYDTSMTLGCEDYLFQLQVARLHAFVCVPGWVMGYRRRHGSMSTDAIRMIRAHLQMYATLERDADPVARRIIRAQVARLEMERARNRGRRGAIGEAARAIRRALSNDWRAATATARREIAVAVRRRHGLFPPAERSFSSYDLQEPDGPWSSGRPARRDTWLANLDEEHQTVGRIQRG